MSEPGRIIRMKHFADGHTEEMIEEASADKELRFRVHRFLEYIGDVRSGNVKRLDRDVVLNLAADIEGAL